MYAFALSLLALALVAAASPAASAATPSFDCNKADSSAEKAVCSVDGLAALDREVARLYKLALDGPHMTAERAKHLKAFQRGWIKGRDDCWKSDLGLETCVAHNYVLRIHELREGYADARADDDAGVSLGPLAYVCEGLDAGLSVVFVNAEDAPYASLKWRENAVALPQALSASGARYAGNNFAGEHEFWIKGDVATFARPNQSPVSCRVDATD